MKKILLSFAMMISVIMSARAMSYEQAREKALFLTDKMAYELDLTESQYEAAFEINLDYLMSVTTADDVYSEYWRRRNLDLSYILLDWQYRTFCGLEYFYRPLYWGSGYWHFRIFAHYPHHNFFYFSRPHFYTTYRGGHAWHRNGGRSWYHGRTFSGSHHRGMRAVFDSKRGHHSNGLHSRPNVSFGRGHSNRDVNHRKGSSGFNSQHNKGHRRDADRVRESSTRRTAGDVNRSSNRSSSNFTPSRSFSGSSSNRSVTSGSSNRSHGSSSGSRSGGSFSGGSRGSSNSSATRSSSGFGGNGGGHR